MKECEMKKIDLDNLIKQNKVQPVGRGYIDCIVTFDNVFEFLNGLSGIGIKVYGVTWWCHSKERNSGCPHGMGGPLSKYHDGWFSEMWFEMLRFDNNNQVASYLESTNDETMHEWFEKRLECFVPALWLDVPDDWRNELE